MKNKPVKHKSGNVFRFQSFSDRIASINVDVIHRIGQIRNAPVESQTFFKEAVEKWSELNCTEDFDNLKRQLGYDLETLPQLLLRKDEVVNILKSQLEAEKNLALDSVLELVVALARDLQYDFYPYYKDFFSLICKHLMVQDADILERTFSCLAYLFKFLWRYMIKDIKNVFRLYLSLLSHEQKAYVRKFASESFAFLMRKVPDKDELFNMVFKYLSKNSQLTEGVGQLLFEIMKGVKHQFHSCSEIIFPIILKRLGCAFQDHGFKYSVVTQAVQHTMLSMAKHASKPNTLTIWKCLCNMLSEVTDCLNSSETDANKIVEHLENILSLFKLWLEFKDGALVAENEIVIKVLTNTLATPGISEKGAEVILHCSKCVLLSFNVKLSVSQISGLINSVYKSSYSRHLIFNFSEELFDYGMFQKDVLPSFLLYCVNIFSEETASEVLSILVRIVSSVCPTVKTGDDLLSWNSLKFVFSSSEDTKEISVTNYIMSYLTSDPEDVENFPKIWTALVCLPHLMSIQNIASDEAVKKLIISLTLLLKSEPKNVQVLSFVFSQAVISAVLCQNPLIICKDLLEEVISCVKLFPENVNILRAVDIYFTHISKQGKRSLLTFSLLEELLKVMAISFSSPYHMVRLLTLRIICTFDVHAPPDPDTEITPASVFTLCLKAEEIPANVEQYREKLACLQKLNHEAVRKHLPVGINIKVPVYYLLGAMQINFKLLWQPIRKILSTHANFGGQQFWEVYIPHLKSVAEKAGHSKTDELLESDDQKSVYNDDHIQMVFEQICSKAVCFEDRPDFILHRIGLWKAMEEFVGSFDTDKKDIVLLFLQFMKNEFWPHTNLAPSQDVRKEKNNQKPTKQPADDSSCVILDDLENEEEDAVEDQPQSVKPKLLTRSICSHLEVLAKFDNPRAVYKQEELFHLYLELLTYHDPKVQKTAFDCIASYNLKYLTLYKDNFLRLMDDKTFRTEIILFKIGSEDGIVQEQHRSKLLPILMRILFGKMLQKMGSNEGGKTHFDARRNLILRFIASSQESEVEEFINLALFSFIQYTSDDILTMMSRIKEEMDLSKIIPIRRLHSTSSTLKSMLSYFGNLLPALLPKFFKVIIALTTYISCLMLHKQEIDLYHQRHLKSLRMQAVDLLMLYFELFETYPFTSDEIDAVFDAAVWPLLSKFQVSGIHKPKPSLILRLFLVWSKNPRYFKLFTKHCPEDPAFYPLTQLISVYMNEKTHRVVIKQITNIIDKLLSYKEVDDGSVAPLNCTKCITMDTCSDSEKDLMNYGTYILLPYVPHILSRLEGKIRNFQKSTRLLSRDELNILCRISEHVKDPEGGKELASVLIPVLTKFKKKTQELEYQLLQILERLMSVIHHPESFIKSFTTLLSTTTSIQSRNILASIFKVIGKRKNYYGKLSEIVQMVHAWNPKFTEEPDYGTRLDGFKLAFSVVSDTRNNPDVDIVLPIIYCCIYTVRTIEDLSLRESASYALQQMMPLFSEWMEHHKEVYKECVTEALLSEIRKGLRSKVEVTRHEFIIILSRLLEHCGEHQSLAGLAQLCDKDKEVDFWENIIHIQMHRRTKALTRFTTALLESKVQLNILSLKTIFLPLVGSFLLNFSYSKYNTLVDAAVEAVGAICSKLPWNTYEPLLIHYISILPRSVEHHKTVVKLIVAILEAFHFKVSRAEEVSVSPAELEPEEDREDVTEDNNTEASIIKDEDVVQEDDVEENDIEIKDGLDTSKTDTSEKEASARIYLTISKRILPKLHKSLTQRSRADDEHKLVKSDYPEDEDILKIPIALAMVKLLQNLPKEMLQHNLPGIFLKICQLLKSRAESIRETSRETLIKMMQSLGPKYFFYLLKEMRGSMKKGYQVHVMTYTVHAVLSSLIEQMEPGDLDNCITQLIEVCHEELFGDVAEEKEVAQITGKIKEARGSKSFRIYNILGKFISEPLLLDLTSSLKEVLITTRNHKTVRIVDECLNQIGLGLSENSSLKVPVLLIYVHKVFEEYHEDLKTKKIKSTSFELPKPEPGDCFILPAEPKRRGLPVKSSKKTNTHVLISHSLKILHSSLKKEKLSPLEKSHLEMLDPFIPLLTEFLGSQNVKIITLTLKCLVWIFKFPLPSLQENIKEIANLLFVLVNKYSGMGMKQGENFDLAVMCFKVIAVLVREVNFYTIEENHLKALLSYVETDIYDHTKQAAAFTLLKSTLSRRFESEELHKLMERIAQMSITDDRENIRNQCRQVYLQYVLDYPLGRKLEKSVAFYVAQLEYEVECGRISAVEMLNSWFNLFPIKSLQHYSDSFFIYLSSSVVNDESPNMRRLSAAAIKNLLDKLDDNYRSSLLSLVVAWLKEKRISSKRLAVQVCGLFAEVEKEKFERYLPELVPIFQELLHGQHCSDFSTVELEKSTDHLLFQLLTCLSKVFSHCPVIREEKYRNNFNDIFAVVYDHLLHPHTWVRLAAAQLFGLLFSTYTLEEIANAVDSASEKTDYLLIDPEIKVKNLLESFCSQLQSQDIPANLADQVIKNLIFLTKVTNSLENRLSLEVIEERKLRTVDWIIKKLSREVAFEVINNPRSIIKRMSVFKYFAAVSVSVPKEKLIEKLPLILLPLGRELEDKGESQAEELKTLIHEVIGLLKKLVGVDIFTKELIKVQGNIVKKKVKRKHEKALEAVSNPEIHAKKKIKRQQAKQALLKRKQALQSGKKVKKRKTERF